MGGAEVFEVVGLGGVDVVFDGDEFEANVEDGSGREVGGSLDVDFAGGFQTVISNWFELDVAVGRDGVVAVGSDPKARFFDFDVDVDFNVDGDFV